MNEPRTLPAAVGGPPVHPRKLAHVVLRVRDLPRARAWYLTVLQARAAFENESVCFLTYDDEHHRIGLIGRPELGAGADAHAGLEHVAFTYATLGELLATYRRLVGEGIAPYWSINHGPTISLYYKDPDGNRLELQYDVFERPEQVEAFFAGGAYQENFIGVRFEPEDLVARYEAGEPVAQLTARPRLAPGSSPWDMVVA